MSLFRSAVEKQVWISAVSVSFCWSLLLTFGATKTGVKEQLFNSGGRLFVFNSSCLSDRGKTRAG